MSDSSGTAEKPGYKDTLCLLSKGEAEAIFPQRANLPQREPEILKFLDELDLYGRIRQARAGQEKYVLHDGPPYANGRIHLGHVLNKTLKDITIRSRALAGKDVPFTPGWDCHGLPIEHKVMQEVRAEGAELPTAELRRRCRNYALKFIDIMQKDFQRLGIVADWEHPYRTLDPAYEAHELRLFSKLVAREMVFRNLKPVYWCPSYETALAEAEVEYHDHTSPSIYVKFPSIDVEEAVGQVGDTSKPLSVLIWTTTPWTLPANLAITLHPDYEYVVMETDSDRMVVARELAARVAQEAGIENYTLHEAPRGQAFENKKCRHPWIDRESLLLVGKHVTLETGSGCVHTAPGHGHEDYLIGLQYGLEVYSPVDARGRFDERVPEFVGMEVEAANPGVVELLKKVGALVWVGSIQHSYPHDWREKKPVIFRATPQWFISLERGGLREHLIEAVDSVQWIPKWGRERIASMLDNRVEWCISRQRAWGVPIPAIHLEESGEAVLDPEFIARLADIVQQTGVDVWFETLQGVENEWTAKVRALVEETLAAKGLAGAWSLEKDTLDVWFDSGSSHQAVLNESYGLHFPADLYLEGSDQHRGWFQSSLNTAVALDLGAPYKAVLTHGFFVDEKGEKLSKSKGNYIEAGEAIKEYGADILRLWVASEDFRNDISVSTNILKQRSEAYRRFRNTFRFLLTSLSDFSLENRVAEEDLLPIDRYQIAKWNELEEQIAKAYETYEFHRVYHLANAYCTVDLSARYLDILKDRLYTFRRDGIPRRSAQTALLRILRGLLQGLSPILVFTCEEAWQSLRKMGLAEEESVALSLWQGAKKSPEAEFFAEWERLFEIREAVNAAIEPQRRDRVLGGSLEAAVEMWVDSEADYELLKKADSLPDGSNLMALFIVSEVHLHAGKGPEGAFQPERLPHLRIKVSKTGGEKCVRCWKFFPSLGSDPKHPEICDRCLEAVEAL
jgi:isoleucyl-tRNA synthetase